jgi:drug/metabolite transporter, DME family
MLIILAAASLWGTSGVVGQYLYGGSEISPLAVGFYRLLLASCVMAVGGLVLLPKGRQRLSASELARVALVGVGLAAYQACFFAAVYVVGVSIATLVTLGLAPILVTVGAAVFLGERAGMRVLLALVAALCGLALLVWDPSGGMRPGILPGAALSAGSALGYAGVTLISKPLSGRVGPYRLTLMGFSVGTCVLFPIVAYDAGLAVEISPQTLLPLLYLGAVPSALAYGLYFTGLRTVRPAVASILVLLEPLTATVLAGLIFGERLGVVGLIGGGMLLAAILILYAGRSRERSTAT